MTHRPSTDSARSSVSSAASQPPAGSDGAAGDLSSISPRSNGCAPGLEEAADECLAELEWVEGEEEDVESSWHSERFEAFYEGPSAGHVRRRRSLTSVRRFLRRQAKGPTLGPTAEPLRPAHWTRAGVTVALLLFLLVCLVLLESLIFGHVPVNVRFGLKWLLNRTRTPSAAASGPAAQGHPGAA